MAQTVNIEFKRIATDPRRPRFERIETGRATADLASGKVQAEIDGSDAGPLLLERPDADCFRADAPDDALMEIIRLRRDINAARDRVQELIDIYGIDLLDAVIADLL